VSEERAPLLIVALDGGDPERILAWAKDGDLPVLASMLERGTAAGIYGPESVSVHGTWATLFTGQSLAEHGGYARRSLRPGTYELEPAPVGGEATTPFWARLDEPRHEILVIDAPETRPIPGLNGRQLADWGIHSAKHPVTEPPELMDQVRRLVGRPIKTNERQRGGRWHDRYVLPQILRRVERKGRLCRALLADRPARIVVVGFGDTHAAGHRYGKYETNDDPMAEALSRVYQAIDDELGRLIDQFDASPNVFVLADSGIREGQPLGTLMDDLCRGLGYKTSQEPAQSRTLQSRIATTLTPILSIRNRTAQREARFLSNIDWSRTSVFAIPSTYTGYLRVNLVGRESEGIVAPGAEYDAVLDRLTSDLALLEDASTGAPVVEKVTRTTDVFGEDPPTKLPDLFVDFRSCSLPQRIVHPRGGFTRERGGDLRDNNHSRRGLILAAGPGIARQGHVGDLSPCEIEPLFRAVAGAKVAADTRRRGIEAFLT
jgi:predicted AlkP superfamily phosphohydrolase/phosphomutase